MKTFNCFGYKSDNCIYLLPMFVIVLEKSKWGGTSINVHYGFLFWVGGLLIHVAKGSFSANDFKISVAKERANIGLRKARAISRRFKLSK